jgi:hypothetical protein
MISAMVRTIVFVVSLMLLTAAKGLIDLSHSDGFRRRSALVAAVEPDSPESVLGKRKL